MAEKSFRQIEADIEGRGYAALLKEAAEEIQNLTRTLGYLLEDCPEYQEDIDKLTASAIRLGIMTLKLSEKDYGRN